MPVIVNVGANLVLGASLALALRRSPALHDGLVSWPLFFLLAFEGLVVTPVSTYLFRFYPQWSLLYWFDPQVLPGIERWLGAISAVVVLLNFGAAIGGLVAARFGIVRERSWMWIAPLAAGSATIAFALVGFGRRIFFIGDHDSFWQGNADMLVTSAPGWAGILLYASTIAFVVFLRRRFWAKDPTFL
jgi:hypothetical protein